MERKIVQIVFNPNLESQWTRYALLSDGTVWAYNETEWVASIGYGELIATLNQQETEEKK